MIVETTSTPRHRHQLIATPCANVAIGVAGLPPSIKAVNAARNAIFSWPPALSDRTTKPEITNGQRVYGESKNKAETPRRMIFNPRYRLFGAGIGITPGWWFLLVLRGWWWIDSGR